MTKTYEHPTAYRSLEVLDPVIQLRNVSKQYGTKFALRDVDLTVPRGVVFALLGENGAGKSTMIKSMLGLVEPDAGELRVLNLDSRDEGLDIRRRVGYVSERPTLYDWMTVREAGWFAAGFYPKGYLPRYEAIAVQFELPLDRKIKALSKGMRAKVALSLAMAHEPELLILDEPTSGLDTLVRRSFLESMVDIAAAGRTIFLSSHQIAEVERVADIVAILRDGHLLLVEPLDELKAECRELTITLADDGVSLPVLNGKIVHERRRAKQRQILTRGLGDDEIDVLRERSGVVELESRHPSLEDIFVAVMQSGREESHTRREAVTA